MSLLNPAERRLHHEAVKVCAGHRRLEAKLVEILLEIETQRIHLRLGHSSLFTYAVNALGLSEPNAYAFISVARKCRTCAPLRVAIGARLLSVSKAARLVAALSMDNAEALVSFATSRSSREIDREVARLKPKAKTADRVRPLSADWERLNCSVSPEVSVMLRRSQSVLSSKLGRPADFSETLSHALSLYLEKHDPVVKAERAQKRKRRADAELCPGRVNNKSRTPLTAAERHAVHVRDGGRCTFIDPATGRRCENDRWLDIHHLVAVANGGGNEPENLRTVCAAHHDLIHQLSLPLEGQVSWLGERRVRYG